MIVLSNRQYPMMKAFLDGGDSYYMDIEEAQRYDQRPFRSMLIRKWIAYRPGRGFHLTRDGRNAWRDYHGTEIWRKNPTLPLTAYFDVTAYHLRVQPKKATVHVMRKSSAA
jgi:hypothetical protein